MLVSPRFWMCFPFFRVRTELPFIISLISSPVFREQHIKTQFKQQKRKRTSAGQFESHSPCHQIHSSLQWCCSSPGHSPHWAVWSSWHCLPILLSDIFLLPGNKQNEWHSFLITPLYYPTTGNGCCICIDVVERNIKTLKQATLDTQWERQWPPCAHLLLHWYLK